MEYAINIIASFVWNMHVKRAMTAAPGRNNGQNFWRVILGSTLDMAVIEWCKLFGSQGEDVHWKKQVPKAEHDAFRVGLCKAVGLSEDAWKDYREGVKAYRDKHAAHFDAVYLDPVNDPKYPDLTTAMSAVNYYYDWLIARMDADGVKHSRPRDLRAYCAAFAANAEKMAIAAYSATARI